MGSIEKDVGIDRAPTKGERVLGIVVATLVSFVLGATSIIGAYVAISHPAALGFGATIYLISVFALFFISLWLLYRVGFTKSRRPSQLALVVSAYAAIVFGGGMILLALWHSQDPRASRLLRYAAGCVAAGLATLWHAKRIKADA